MSSASLAPAPSVFGATATTSPTQLSKCSLAPMFMHPAVAAAAVAAATALAPATTAAGVAAAIVTAAAAA